MFFAIQGCGKSRTLKIDWNIRIRGCQSCLKNLYVLTDTYVTNAYRNHFSLVWSTKFERRYPGLPLEIMDLLPYTRSLYNRSLPSLQL